MIPLQTHPASWHAHASNRELVHRHDRVVRKPGDPGSNPRAAVEGVRGEEVAQGMRAAAAIPASRTAAFNGSSPPPGYIGIVSPASSVATTCTKPSSTAR
jgi:hypothetical protein